MLTVQQWNSLRAGAFTGPPRSYVSITPGMRFGDPCIAKRRIGTRMIADIWWAGTWSLAELAYNYDLTRDDVLVACWFEAMHGTRATRRRWGAWAAAQFGTLWRMRWDDVPMPPQKPARVEAAAC